MKNGYTYKIPENSICFHEKIVFYMLIFVCLHGNIVCLHEHSMSLHGQVHADDCINMLLI